MNNLTTTELTFNVVSGLRPGLIDINCTANPRQNVDNVYHQPRPRRKQP